MIAELRSYVCADMDEWAKVLGVLFSDGSWNTAWFIAAAVLDDEGVERCVCLDHWKHGAVMSAASLTDISLEGVTAL